ncbi:MAG TPA: GatB/YqeY domain-containing protein [Saprospiraceae bacterium]|nr:GatB/YqeY domain-containing protein [Saprospiraceae bacterium]
MTLEERITQDLKTAMKEKNDAAKRGIRAIKQAIILAKTDGSGNEITEDMEIKMLTKLAKQRKESLEIYEEQGREDLAKTEREELEIIERYLPEQMSEEELTTKIKAIIGRLGASSMKDMGKVMGMATKEFAGKADGKLISQLVRKELS